MNYFLTRNEIFQKPNTDQILENQEKFSVKLRKNKRQACFDSYRKSTIDSSTSQSMPSIPPELLEIEKNLRNPLSTQQKLLSLLHIATREKTENAILALKYLNVRAYEFDQISDEVPKELLEGLVYHLRYSKGELQLSTMILIETIISGNNIRQFFQFSNTKLLDILIDLLKSESKQLMIYSLNAIFNYIFSYQIPIDSNSKLLNNLFSILNNPELATTQNKVSVAYMFKQLKFNSVSDDLVLEVARWLIKFVQDPGIELKQIGILALKTLISDNIIMTVEVMNGAEEILNLLDCSIVFILKSTLDLIQVITAGKDSDTQILLNLGLLDKLTRILIRFWNPGNKLCYSVAVCISNILAGTEDQILFTLSYSTSFINHFLSSNDPSIYNEGLFCIMNVISGKSKVAKLKVIKSDILACMFQSLCVFNDYESLKNLSQIYKIMKRIQRSINGNDWIELIENLQSQFIFEKISGIIDMKDLKNVKIVKKLEKILKIIQQKQVKKLNLIPTAVFNFS